MEIRTLQSQLNADKLQLETTQEQLAISTDDLTSSLEWRDRHLQIQEEKEKENEKILRELKSEVRTLGASLESSNRSVAQQETARISGEKSVLVWQYLELHFIVCCV